MEQNFLFGPPNPNNEPDPLHPIYNVDDVKKSRRRSEKKEKGNKQESIVTQRGREFWGDSQNQNRQAPDMS